MKPRIEIIGEAELAAPYIEWAIRLMAAQTIPVAYRYVDSCVIQLLKVQNLVRFIVSRVGGFVCHPRTSSAIDTVMPFGAEDDYVDFSVPGGISYSVETKQLTELTTNYIYPLLDSDNASYLFNASGSTHLLSAGAYGNIYWTNGADIITYKGTPSRHGILSEPVTGIDAVAAFSLGYNFYQAGTVLAASPNNNPILGGSILNNTLIGIFAFEQNPLKKYEKSAWVDIPISNLDLTYFFTQWWFSPDGVQAATDNCTLSICLVTWTAQQNVLPEDKLVVTVSNYGADLKTVEYNGQMRIWHEYSDVLKYGSIKSSNSFNSVDMADSTLLWLSFDYPHFREDEGTYTTIEVIQNEIGYLIRAKTDQDPVGCPACWDYDLDGLIEVEKYDCIVLAKPPSECREAETVFSVTATGTGAYSGMQQSIDIILPATPGVWVDTVSYTNPFDWYTCGSLNYCNPSSSVIVKDTSYVKETIQDNHARVSSISCTNALSPNCGAFSSDRPYPAGLTGESGSTGPVSCYDANAEQWVDSGSTCISYLMAHYRKEFVCL